MIIKSISLHNFMSYEEAHIDMSQIKIACLIGLNGAGKSAILDSITYAIWDKARSSSDELIKQGQEEMWVNLEFIHLNNLYRIRRSKLKTHGRSSSKSNLDFMVFDPNSQENQSQGNWVDLSGNSIKETQNQIDEILKMRYETFINSVYLRQGKADEFTIKSPSQRKEILAEILDLSYYDKLQEKAKEKTKEIEIKIAALEHSLKDQFDLENEIAEISNQINHFHPQVEKLTKGKEDLESQLANAKEKLESAKIAKAKSVELSKQLLNLDKDLSQLDLDKQKLEQENKNISQVLEKQSEIIENYNKFESTKAQVEVFDNKFQTFQELTLKIINIEKQIEIEENNLNNKLNSKIEIKTNLIQKIEDLNNELKDSEKIEKEYIDYKTILDQETLMSKKEESYHALLKRKQEIEQLISNAKIKLESNLEEKKRHLNELNKELGNQDKILIEKHNLENKINELNLIETELNHIEESGSSLKSIIESKKIENTNLEYQINEINLKITQIDKLETNSLCPLCLSKINDKSKVLEHYQNELKNIQNLIETNNNNIFQNENRLTDLRNKYSKNKSKLKDRDLISQALGQIINEEKTLQNSIKNKELLEAEIQQIELKINNNSYLQVEQTSLADINKEIEDLSFDPIIFSNLQSEIKAKKNIEFRHSKLQNNRNIETSLKNDLTSIDNEINFIKKQLTEFAIDLRKELDHLKEAKNDLNYNQEDHLKLKNELKNLAKYAQEYHDIKTFNEKAVLILENINALNLSINEKNITRNHINTSLAECIELYNQTENLEENINHIITAKNSINEELSRATKSLHEYNARFELKQSSLNQLHKAKTEQDLLHKSLNDYKKLVEVLGKKGIQAAIIENSIPEIEAEANRLLQKLSNNQMHIAFSTQSKLKSGSIAETLDIVIADSVGTRPYELFSGGEAFRANFAIRIALSKLLTRKSQAKLETLIIDEGFGSQDDESREKLVRTIKSIQDEFACILVISHMSDIKEMFKTQIEITKNNGTSTITVIK